MTPAVRGECIGRVLSNKNHLTIPHSRTSSYQRSFIPETTRHWNALPHTIRYCQETKQFKQDIKLLYGTQPPPHYFTLGTKLGNTLHTQLRVGMSKLNAHQYSLQKVTAPTCACGYRQENPRHFLLHCPQFAVLRSNLFQQVTTHLDIDFQNISDTLKMETLLNGKHMTKHASLLVSVVFQKFLENTSRLS